VIGQRRQPYGDIFLSRFFYQRKRPVPEKKVTAATLAGAIVTIAVWILKLAGVDIPAGVATAITTVLVGVAGYMAPHTHRPDLAQPAGKTGTS
jgi:hypothetical protein